MTIAEILDLRLQNQYLQSPKLQNPADVVRWLGAVQAQDYAGAKWAVAQRTTDATSADLDQALAEGKILRIHVMRPTWHFVAPEDIGWMLALTAPRIKKAMASREHSIGLDETLVTKANKTIVKALSAGKQLTRIELAEVLNKAGIDTKSDNRLSHLLARAELDALICSNALRGKQHTYTLLEERVPKGKTLTREESLTELARRYFTSHGPATIKDFAWWSGLTISDAKAGIQDLKPALKYEPVHGQTYWYNSEGTKIASAKPYVHLLPNYDEYIVAYTDRSAFFDQKHISKLGTRGNPLFNNVILADGQIAGTWKPVTNKNTIIIETVMFEPLTKIQKSALAETIKRYAHYTKMSTRIYAH